jgi:hypothetical protein
VVFSTLRAVIDIGKELIMNLQDIAKIREVNPVVVNYANFVTPIFGGEWLKCGGSFSHHE